MKVTAQKHRPTKRLEYNHKITESSPSPTFHSILIGLQYKNSGLQPKELQDLDPLQGGTLRKPKSKRETNTRALEEFLASRTDSCSKHDAQPNSKPD